MFASRWATTHDLNTECKRKSSIINQLYIEPGSKQLHHSIHVTNTLSDQWLKEDFHIWKRTLLRFFSCFQEPYHLCVAHEDLDKSLNLCRVFTELAETFLVKMVNFNPATPHFAITILDNILICCGHPDYEIPDITFNFWYR